MEELPWYLAILIIALVSTILEVIFESVLKIRSRLQKRINSRILYCLVAISIVFLVYMILHYIVDRSFYPYLEWGIYILHVYQIGAVGFNKTSIL